MGHIGLMVLTGEVGTGKTTIARHTATQFCDDRQMAVIHQTNVSPNELIHLITSAFKIDAQGDQKTQQLDALKRFLRQKQKDEEQILIIVEEAQGLSDDTLEEIRLLTNMQMDYPETLQILLIGQPDFLERLQSPRWASLGQRVGVGFHLEALGFEQTCCYIRHRLATVGGQLKIFSKDALKQIFKASGGIPRLINLFCNGALIYGYGDELKTINANLIKKVVKERAGIGLGHSTRALITGDVQHQPTKCNGNFEERFSRLEADIKQISDQLEWHKEDISILNTKSKDDLFSIVKSIMAKERRLRKHLEREIKQLTRSIKKAGMPHWPDNKKASDPPKSSTKRDHRC